MRHIFLGLLALHGLAHLPGFLGGWNLTELRGMPYHTTVLAGHVNVGDGGMRLLGTLWLLVAIGFEVAAIGGVLHRPWWGPVAAGLATLSLCMSLVQGSDARIGAVINVIILCVLGIGQYLAWETTIG